MTWTQKGVDYVCQKYGDINECVVSNGLVFSYTDIQDQTYTGVTGGTADIVGFISFGLVKSITMTNPSRPTITDPQTKLNNANGGVVNPTDAQELANHDERSADQWCYIVPPPCSSYTNQVDCEAHNCYWWNGTCHDVAPSCEELLNEPDCSRYKCYWYDGACHSEPQYPCDHWTNQTDCEANNCYWYDGACHSTPQKKEEIPWLLYAGIVTVVVGGIAVIIKKWG